MPKASPKHGKGPCPSCGADVWFRVGASGSLKYRCESCDSSGFAEEGGAAFRRWQASVKEPAAPAPIDPPPAPAPARRGAAPAPFSLDAI